MTERESGNQILMEHSQLEPNSQLNLEQSRKDDRRACLTQIVQYVLVGIISLAYLVYLYHWVYKNTSKNSSTSVSIESSPEYIVPYILIYTLPYIKNLGVESLSFYNTADGNAILEPSKSVDGSDIQQNIITKGEASDFVYDSSVTQWQIYRYVGYGLNVTVLAPPYGETMNVSEVIDLSLSSYSKCHNHQWTNVNEQDYYSGKYNDLATVVQVQQFEGQHYGFYWYGGPVENLKNLSYEYLTMEYINMHYTFPSEATQAQLSLTVRKDDIKGTTDKSYDLSIQGSPVNAHYLFSKASVLTNYCWKYGNTILLTMNPSGGGVKTVITTSQLKSFTDILSQAGGIFGPLNTGAGLLFGILLSKFLAKKQGWDEQEKLKAALYLKELQLLTDQQYLQAGKNVNKGQYSINS